MNNRELYVSLLLAIITVYSYPYWLQLVTLLLFSSLSCGSLARYFCLRQSSPYLHLTFCLTMIIFDYVYG